MLNLKQKFTVVKNQYSYFFLLLFLFLAQLSLAQNYKDCETARLICGGTNFTFDNMAGEGELDPGVESTCVGSESSSIWIRWTIVVGGDLTFELIPNDANQDLDFLLYKLNFVSDCDEKELIRCMASGENVGAPFEEWERCTGPTGLATGEVDVEEGTGCAEADNNFLAPLETVIDDQYVLMVNDFSVTALGFALNFGGSASLDCSTPTNAIEINNQFKISPTISSGSIHINFDSELFLEGSIAIHNLNGQKIYAIENVSQFGYTIDLTNFPSGFYLASFQKNDIFVTKKFIIQH